MRIKHQLLCRMLCCPPCFSVATVSPPPAERPASPVRECMVYVTCDICVDCFSVATVSPPPAERPASPVRECMVCCDVTADVTFQPCGHKIVCVDCCIKMKKCLVCMKTISKKLGPGTMAILLCNEWPWLLYYNTVCGTIAQKDYIISAFKPHIN